MSTRTATHRTRARSAGRPSRTAAARRRRLLRRRLGFLGAVAVAGLAIALAIAPWADQAVQEVTLPLRHEDIIRQQASDKDLDPALIAGVIFAESHFRDQTSQVGARGEQFRAADHIPFPETRDYVKKVLAAREDYRREYAGELGL